MKNGDNKKSKKRVNDGNLLENLNTFLSTLTEVAVIIEFETE